MRPAVNFKLLLNAGKWFRLNYRCFEPILAITKRDNRDIHFASTLVKTLFILQPIFMHDPSGNEIKQWNVNGYNELLDQPFY